MQEEMLKKIASLLEEIRDISQSNRDNYTMAVKDAKRMRKIAFPVLGLMLITWFYFVVISFLR